MFISRNLAPYIHSKGIIGINPGQWIRFHNLPGRDLAIADIYAPHSSTQNRIHLWQELVRTLDPSAR